MLDLAFILILAHSADSMLSFWVEWYFHHGGSFAKGPSKVWDPIKVSTSLRECVKSWTHPALKKSVVGSKDH